MKKNLLTVVILALVVVNLILTAVLTISILPQTKKANELITQVCTAINLELKSGSLTSDSVNLPIDQIATHDIEEMTINLKTGEDGKSHYALLAVTLSMDTQSDGYKEYGASIAEKESLIKSEINTIVSGYTYEEFNGNQAGVQKTILSELQKMFNSDFIVSIGFRKYNCQ